MKLFLSSQKASRFTFNLFNILLILSALSTLLLILLYPYKQLIIGNVVVDIDVNLRNKSFNGIVKAAASNYFVLSGPKGVLSMTPQNIWVYFLAQSKYFYGLIAGFIVLYNARKLLRKIKEEKAFDNDSGRIVRLIAVIVMVTPFILAVRTYLLNQYIPDNLIINGFQVIKTNPFDLRPFMHGIIWGSLLMAFANVFSQGSRIKEENDLTV